MIILCQLITNHESITFVNDNHMSINNNHKLITIINDNHMSINNNYNCKS
jgi:hypothetical protein